MDRLVLEVRRFDGPAHWYWTLTDLDGRVLTDHEVSLDPAADEYQAFTRLERHLALHADPTRPLAGETEILDRVGRWIGAHVFGPIGPAIIERVERGPLTVEVRVPDDPPEARQLLFRPLELAVIGEQPLARCDVSLVMVPPGPPACGGRRPVQGALRMLAVFSLPDTEQALALREQRRALTRQLHTIRARYSKAIDLHILQYGATRDRLRALLEDGDGWDVIHISGHGRLDAVILEQPGGGSDPVGADELVAMLRVARDRLKLLVLSSCNSAAAPRALPPVLAEEAVRRLGCAVLAMRYRVDDDFSTTLTGHLYDRMFGAGQSLPRALQLALPRALGDRPTPGTSPLSVAVPALFGACCVDLTLRPPDAPPATFTTARQTMVHFPPEPERVIGRSGLLHRAAAALTTTPGPVGLLLTGPAGIGTSTCAVELAYAHEYEFAAHAWYRPPHGETRLDRILTAFAECLDRQLPGLDMAAETGNSQRLHAFLPHLTELMERNAILVVIDAVDGLLGQHAQWRDPNWEQIIHALLGHDGLSRVILTARRVPAGLSHRVHAETVPPLSPRESVLLARYLPTVGTLMKGHAALPPATVKATVGALLTRAAGNPATLLAEDRELARTDGGGISRIQAGSAGPVTPEYGALLDRWILDAG
ncbi:CHAT domain-containing protein [Frankia sp. Cr2]|uniref:CHAT domain-containing protein n=1 Tax=Frankia sp. Cr2 TaxID=3073932 RepID=UPI002AD2B725|nr:CHAT domain-containing protein [Frankia sp. Cr2]